MATLKDRKELIESLQIPGRERTAGLRQDADVWLRNWRNERGINPNSGVIPNDPAEAPAHLRFTIFGRRAEALPQRDGMKIAHGDGGGWEHLDKTAKDRIRRPEFEADIIKGLEEGTILPSDAAEMLRIPEEELPNIINKFQTDKLKIKK